MIPCLSSGLAKTSKIMSMFVLFSRLFGHFESLAFSKMGGTYDVIGHIFENFFLYSGRY